MIRYDGFDLEAPDRGGTCPTRGGPIPADRLHLIRCDYCTVARLDRFCDPLDLASDWLHDWRELPAR